MCLRKILLKKNIAKGYCRNNSLTRVLLVTAILTIALRCEVKIQQTP